MVDWFKRMKGRVSGAKDKKWSEESKLKLSNSKKGRITSNAIPIYQYSREGRFINEFRSISEAERLTGSKGIIFYLRGKYKHVNNFLWSKQKTEYLPGS